MRAEASRSDLSKALSQVTRVVESRSPIPTLNCVYLKVAGGVMTLRGTDLQIEITTTLPVKGEDFEACLPGKAFADIVKRLPGDVVSIEFEAGQNDTGTAKIKAGRSRFSLPSISPNYFPTLAIENYDCSFSVDLSLLLARVQFAVGESNHANTDGAYLHVADRMLRVVGTDTHRLAIYQTDVPAGAEAMPGVILPPKLVALIPKGEIALSVCEARLLVSQPGITICGKLIEGTYLTYGRAVPLNNERIVELRKSDLAAAVQRIALVAEEAKGKAVRLNLAPGSIQLVAQDQTGREAVDEIAVDYNGEPTFVAFNCGYLEQMLSAVPGDEIAFDITDNTAFTRVRSLSDANFTGVLSPYRM